MHCSRLKTGGALSASTLFTPCSLYIICRHLTLISDDVAKTKIMALGTEDMLKISFDATGDVYCRRNFVSASINLPSIVITKCKQENHAMDIVDNYQHAFAETLSKHLWTMRAVDGSCDATLVCSGKEFPAHRLVLCAHSDVFTRMLSGSMMEASSGRIKIEDTDPNVVETFIKYAYVVRTLT